MSRLERPSGYFQTRDVVTGRSIEGETRTCVHCGYMWIYNPRESFDRKIAGKPVVRGQCMRCVGFVCARKECLKKGCIPRMRQIEDMEGKKRSGIVLM